MILGVRLGIPLPIFDSRFFEVQAIVSPIPTIKGGSTHFPSTFSISLAVAEASSVLPRYTVVSLDILMIGVGMQRRTGRVIAKRI